MKNLILRASTAAFAAGLAFAVGCGSSSSCGGTNLNDNSSSGQISMTCGSGTYRNSSNQCVPLPSSNSNTSSGQNTQAVRHITTH